MHEPVIRTAELARSIKRSGAAKKFGRAISSIKTDIAAVRLLL
jgi:hypothetical protein